MVLCLGVFFHPFSLAYEVFLIDLLNGISGWSLHWRVHMDLFGAWLRLEKA